ncbi:MAG: fumarylacetoacetate hydrolase family protein [Candidatus Methanofastidiosia archaeon]|jgi:2-keto-4-pentenoate hydratase/2-oxohepta-3-ene-1,7-dioic acid hydratase in catechol pathway
MIIQFGTTQIDLTPTKIVAVARNYKAHAEEMGTSVPDIPTIFLKPPSSLIGDNGVVILPAVSNRVDYEVELAVIMKTRCTKVSAEEALEHIMGYTVFIDVTARDIQKVAKEKGAPWAVAKGFDTFSPLGPQIVPAGTIDPDNSDIWLKVNNEQKQKSNTKNMIFSVGELISYISSVMTLEPMDIIATGTPEGVGPLEDKDTVKASIAGIGVLTFTVQKE